MLVFDPGTGTVTRFTLARAMLNQGYYEIAKDKLVEQITRDFGSLPAEKEQKIRTLSIAALDELEAALWDLDGMPDLEEFLAGLAG